MTESSEDALERQERIFEAIRKHLARAVDMLSAKIDALEAEDGAEAKKLADGLHASLLVFLSERDRIEKRLEAHKLESDADGLDLRAAMAEIESRLSRIHERNGQKDVS